jgi:hypothetical protein
MSDLRARLAALRAALETQGYRALPCATCGREGDVRVHDLHELAALLREPPAVAPPDCCWTLNDADCDAWATECGQTFQFTTDGPRENDFRFCYWCGRRLTVGDAARPAAPPEDTP